MRRLKQVDQLVHDEVLHALPRLFGQLGIEPNRLASVVAAAPFCFHVLDEQSLHRNTEDWRPSRDDWYRGLTQDAPVPFLKDLLARAFTRFWPHPQNQLVVAQLDLWRGILLDKGDHAPFAKDVVAF